MPYASDAQRKFFHANRQRLESQGVDVDEWDRASKGKNLPERAKKKGKHKKAAWLFPFIPDDMRDAQIVDAIRGIDKAGASALASIAAAFGPSRPSDLPAVTASTANTGTPAGQNVAKPDACNAATMAPIIEKQAILAPATTPALFDSAQAQLASFEKHDPPMMGPWQWQGPAAQQNDPVRGATSVLGHSLFNRNNFLGPGTGAWDSMGAPGGQAAKVAGDNDREHKLLSHMESKGHMDKGRAIAIAKSRGWVKQEGKHLSLTQKGETPRANVDKPESKEKHAKIDPMINIDFGGFVGQVQALINKRREKRAVSIATGTAARKRVPKSEFAYTGKAPKGESKKKAKGKYPMPDARHAAAAKGFAAMHHGKGSAEYKRVAAKAKSLGYGKSSADYSALEKIAIDPTLLSGLVGAGVGTGVGGAAGALSNIQGGYREPISEEIAQHLSALGIPSELIQKLLSPDEYGELAPEEVQVLSQAGVDYDEIAPKPGYFSNMLGGAAKGGLIGGAIGGIGGAAAQELPRLAAGMMAPSVGSEVGASKVPSWLPDVIAGPLKGFGSSVGSSIAQNKWNEMPRADQFAATEKALGFPLPATVINSALDRFKAGNDQYSALTD